MTVINRVIPGFEHRCVGLDNLSGGEMATRLLISQGHQRIGYLGSTHEIEDNTLRYQGYTRAMKAAGLTAGAARYAAGSPDSDGGEAAMIELLGRNQALSAVFAYNDTMAAGAMSVLNENGIRVPQQFSLIGFDDIPAARFTTPKLTTVRYPVVSMAMLATELALAGAAGTLPRRSRMCLCQPWLSVTLLPTGDLSLCKRFQSVSLFTDG